MKIPASRRVDPRLLLIMVGLVLPAVVGWGRPVPAAATGAEPGPTPSAELVARVRALGLGIGEYRIGSRLSSDQMLRARENALPEAYPGTIKFASGEVRIVVDAESGLVLAIYERREEAQAADVRRMIGYLMGTFGEPTIMAHDKLVYWAFDQAGRIDQATYEQARAVGGMEILATVKFSSDLVVQPGLNDEDMAETGTIYYIIASDRLLDSFVGSR